MLTANETIIVDTIDELDQAAQKLIEFSNGQLVWLFDGHMGAGKTTLIKAICKNLGVTTHVQSPTFSIVNEYKGNKNYIYHFDLYRLKNGQELFEIGFEEYLDSKSYCFIEWPDIASELWPTHYFTVKISSDEQNRRIIESAIYVN